MKKKKLSTKTIAMLAMMIAIALVFSYVETLIPINFGIPGVKLGLANLAIVAVLYIMGGKQALYLLFGLSSVDFCSQILHPSCTVWREGY